MWTHTVSNTRTPLKWQQRIKDTAEGKVKEIENTGKVKKKLEDQIRRMGSRKCTFVVEIVKGSDKTTFKMGMQQMMSTTMTQDVIK